MKIIQTLGITPARRITIRSQGNKVNDPLKKVETVIDINI